MKRTFVSSLVVVILSASLAPIASAQTTEMSLAPSTEVSVSRADATPFDLVSLAYQGFLEAEGIPMADGLINRYESGNITARDVVQAGINSNRLSSDRLDDSSYISSVNTQLNSFIRYDD